MYNYSTNIYLLGLTIQHTIPFPALVVTSYHTTLLVRS